MYTNVNLAAPLGVLALLGTGLLLSLLASLVHYSLLRRRGRLLALSVASFLVVASAYLAALLTFSLSSSENLLTVGQEKHFCEIDCHLAYSITDVKRTKSLGSADNQITANGNYYVITIKTRFDETTISPQRGNALLYPNGRRLVVRDEAGRKFLPVSGVEKAFAAKGGMGVSLDTPLRPSESYTTVVVFDLPSEVAHPSLLIHESKWATYLIVGHENSPFHKTTRLQI